MELSAASNRLSKLDLRFTLDDLKVQVLWFRVMQMEGDWLIRRHTHSSFEFHFVADGSCRVRLDGREFAAHKGEFYLTAPGVFHEQAAFDEKTSYTEYSINVDFSTEQGYYEGAELLKIFASSGCNAVKDEYGAIQYFENALKEAYDQRVGFCNSIKGLAVQILVSAARALGGPARRTAVPLKASGNDLRFSAIRSFMEDNLSASFTAEDLNRQFYLSSRQISRIIYEQTGKSTKRFVNFLKLQKAKSMLRDTDLSLQEISDRLGFSSVYYFNQFFKREEGYPPGTFRSNVRKH